MSVCQFSRRKVVVRRVPDAPYENKRQILSSDTHYRVAGLCFATITASGLSVGCPISFSVLVS